MALVVDAERYYIGLKDGKCSCKVLGGYIFTEINAALDAAKNLQQDTLVSKIKGGFLFEDVLTSTDVWISDTLDANGRKLKPYEIAADIIKDYHFISIGEEPGTRNLYMYRDDHYVFCSEAEVKAIVYNRNKAWSSKFRREVVECIILDDTIAHSNVTQEYMCFNNGILRLDDLELLPHDPKYICTTKIPHNFIGLPELKAVENYQIFRSMKTWTDNDQDIYTLLLEMGGYCFQYNVARQKAFIISGDKANGKSAFLRFLQFCLGKDNYSSIDMGELSDRFTKIQIMDVLANISDDISDQSLNRSTISTFKKMVTGDTITAEKKGKDPIKFDPFATMIFTCNEIPKAADPKGALARRLIYIPFNHTFSDDERDFHIYEKLNTEENAEAFISTALTVYKAAEQRGHFTTSEKLEELANKQKVSNSTVLAWADEYLETWNNDINCLCVEPIGTLYKLFEDYCSENGHSYVTPKPAFSSEIHTAYGLKTTKKRNSEGKQVKFFALACDLREEGKA